MQILISREEIARRVEMLAEEIATDYAGKEPTLLVCLKGALIFAGDLARALSDRGLDCPIEVLTARSYDGTERGELSVAFPPAEALRDRDLIVVEDVIDSGATLSAVKEELQKQARSVALATFLNKGISALHDDYCAFDAPKDAFVVGYGMDCDQRMRGLPDVWVLNR